MALPQSITQEEEERSLKNRFGVEQLPGAMQLHSKVQITQSGGTGGPDRRRRSMILAALLILLLGGAVLAYFAQQKGGFAQLLERP